MNTFRIYSIFTDGNCLVMCIIGIVVARLWAKAMGKAGRIVTAIFAVHAVQLTANMTGLIYKGIPGTGVHIFLLCSNFIEFLTGYIVAFLLTRYIISCIDLDDAQGLEIWKSLSTALLALESIVLIVSQFTGLYYTIGQDNYYQRSSYYPLSLAIGLSGMVINFCLIYI